MDLRIQMMPTAMISCSFAYVIAHINEQISTKYDIKGLH